MFRFRSSCKTAFCEKFAFFTQLQFLKNSLLYRVLCKKYQNFLAKAFRFLCFLLLVGGNVVFALPKQDESKDFLLVEKAKEAYREQRHIEAQEIFLEALSLCTTEEKTAPSPEEEQVVELLVPMYASSSGSLEKAQKLAEEVMDLSKKHPDFYLLGFFEASVYANRGEFVSFFDTFFKAYKKHPDFFLALKMKRVLHLRLFEASSNEALRIWHRDQAVIFFQKAFLKRPSDASLLVKLVFLLPNEEKKKLLESVSDDIVHIEIPLQRGECMYLIQQALELRCIEVAKRLIEKAHIWYQYSRALQDLTKQLQELES
jgi:tetratricopeptide (TPR) repeat protein